MFLPLSSHTTSGPEIENCEGQHGENREAMCMIPYWIQGFLNHTESCCDCSVDNLNRASVQLN